MRFFVVANSNAAPIVSDTSHTWVEGDTPAEAMSNFVATYSHPCGLFAANLYADANSYHSSEDPIEQWRSQRAMSLGRP